MRVVVVAVCLSLVVPVINAAEPVLFPAPLHMTREVRDGVSQTTRTIEEYCEGDRVIAVAGDRTVVTDYRAQTITRIDRQAGTYSVASFPAAAVHAAAKSQRAWRSRSAAPETIASRSVDVVELEDGSSEGLRRIRIAATTDVKLSRAAVEVIIGAAYPAPRSEAADAILQAIRSESPSASAGASYRLPLETTMTWNVAGESVELSSKVVALDFTHAPVDLSAIPPGARRIEPPPHPEAALLELEAAAR